MAGARKAGAAPARRFGPIALLLAMLFAGPQAPLAASTEWVRDNEGCEIWRGDEAETRAVSKVTWQGDCLDGRADGAGWLVVVLGAPGGPDAREMTCGCVATEGRVIGAGTITGPAFGRYDGELVNARPHGHGIRIYKSGERYEGAWRGGLRHGRGEVTSPSGWLYRGDFARDVFAGRGRSEWQNGDWHEGGYVAGLRHGEGVYGSTSGGWRYEGRFENGVRQGKGMLYLKTGHTFSGLFKNGKPDGKGVCLDPVSKKRGACRYSLGRFREWLD